MHLDLGFLTLLFGISFLSRNHVASTIVNNGNQINCVRASVSSVSVANCASEPCTIRKGVQLPIQIEFEFEEPAKTNDIVFMVQVAKNEEDPDDSVLIIGSGIDCQELHIAGCPAQALNKYTLHSQLYIDPENDVQGQRNSNWVLSPVLTWFDPNQNESSMFSMCDFEVKLDVLETIQPFL